jgi:hypothetical protein
VPDLPDDFSDLESALAGRSTPEPGPELRDRVLGAVNRELKRRPSFRISRMRPWQFAAAAAAIAFCVLNLSMSAANNTDWRFSARAPATDIQTLADEIQTLLPDLDRGEALRHAHLLRASERTAVPNINLSRHATRQTEAEWDTH